MKVVKVVRVSTVNAAVRTNTGVRVRVPVDLGFEGAELDDDRVHQKSSGKYVYVSANSSVYKRKYAERYSHTVKVEDWNEFFHLSKWYLRRFVRAGWIKGYQLDDWYDDWLSLAYDSGVCFRMAQMDNVHRRRYMYSFIKGFLVDGINKRVREPELVSFDVLESVGIL